MFIINKWEATEIQNDVNFQFTERSACSICGSQIKELLFTVATSNHIAEKYFACPKCLTKIKPFEKRTNQTVKPQITIQEETSPTTTLSASQASKPEGCGNYLGYLKKRPKNTPIPDACLTCIGIIDCTR